MKDIDVEIAIKCKERITYFQCEDKENDEFKVVESKYLNDKEYSFKYKYFKIPTINGFNPRAKGGHAGLNEYFKSSKLTFTLETTKQVTLFKQKNTKINEITYTLNIPLPNFNLRKKGEIYTVPSLFIFLIDQSGSMSGSPMELVKQALKLFLHSIPKGSFYQLIGFGSRFEFYDKNPTPFTIENVSQTISVIDNMSANKGGTDIYGPLKEIFGQFNSTYKQIPLSKNVILLTDGEVNNRADTLNLIENNSNNFTVHSIGIGSSFDKLLIENAGKLGKGGFSFAENVEKISEAVIKQVEKCVEPSVKNIKVEIGGIQKEDIVLNTEFNDSAPDWATLSYSIVLNKEAKLDKIKVDFTHKLSNEKEVKITKEYVPSEILVSLPDGEDLTKLAINSYFNEGRSKLDQNTLVKLSLKYQVLSSATCLFSEVELDEKNTGGMKKITNEAKTVIISEPKFERFRGIGGFARMRKCDAAPKMMCKMAAPRMMCCDMESRCFMDRPKKEIVFNSVGPSRKYRKNRGFEMPSSSNTDSFNNFNEIYECDLEDSLGPPSSSIKNATDSETGDQFMK